MRGVSRYDTTHSVNASFVYQLPVGRGKRFGTGMNRVLDAIVGGWEITGLYRRPPACRSRRPTASAGPPTGTWAATPLPTASRFRGRQHGRTPPAIRRRTQPVGEPERGLRGLPRDFAGESGGRYNLRGQGIFNIDTGVYKNFTMPWSEKQKLQVPLGEPTT